MLLMSNAINTLLLNQKSGACKEMGNDYAKALTPFRPKTIDEINDE